MNRERKKKLRRCELAVSNHFFPERDLVYLDDLFTGMEMKVTIELCARRAAYLRHRSKKVYL